MDEIIEGRNDRGHKQNPIVHILLFPVQVLSWMWHDIKPDRKVIHYRHHRSFMRRVWDNITEPFHQMALDIFGNTSTYRRRHHRSRSRRIWDAIKEPFHAMAQDLKKNPNDDTTLWDKIRGMALMTRDSIKGDFIFHINRETMAQALYLTLILIIFIRIIAVWKTMDLKGLDPLYTYRHIIFTIVWGTLMYFFFNLFLLKKTISPLIQNLREMERASLMAFIACIIKFCTSAAYIFVYRIATLALNWATFYYIGELLIWSMLSVFLFYYWRGRIKVRKMAQLGKFEA